MERLPKGINYGAYIGHSALRMYTMGERALDRASPTKTSSQAMGDAVVAEALTGGR